MAERHRGVSRASTVIAAFSTIVEWYDFTLYLYFATVLSRVYEYHDRFGAYWAPAPLLERLVVQGRSFHERDLAAGL